MNETPKSNEPLFSEMRVPEPPEELRRKVLQRAERAMANGVGADPWLRIWESRWTRLAWAASVLVLALCHIVLPGSDARPTSETPGLAQDANGERDELAAIVSLPRLSLDAQPVAASLRTLRDSESDPSADAPAAAPEENAS
jgi:hypothetical protein